MTDIDDTTEGKGADAPPCFAWSAMGKSALGFTGLTLLVGAAYTFGKDNGDKDLSVYKTAHDLNMTELSQSLSIVASDSEDLSQDL